jgi:hypothetical protein
MSRQYNPVIAAYNNLMITEREKPLPKPEAKGLLSPRNIKERTEQKSAQDQPMARVLNHVTAIRNRRKNLNGN